MRRWYLRLGKQLFIPLRNRRDGCLFHSDSSGYFRPKAGQTRLKSHNRGSLVIQSRISQSRLRHNFALDPENSSSDSVQLSQRALNQPGNDESPNLRTPVEWFPGSSIPDIDRKYHGEASGPLSKISEKREQDFSRWLRDTSDEEIEKCLQRLVKRGRSWDEVGRILDELVTFRHVRPQVSHYEALILCNGQPRPGSLSNIQAILQEIEDEKIGFRHSIFSAVLRALSTNPDAELLAWTEARMSEHWVSPTITDTTHIIMSLIESNQLELAFERLTRLIVTSPQPRGQLRVSVPQSLYESLLYRLSSSECGDHTASLHLIYLLQDYGLPLKPTCASSLLDSAAASLHLDLTLHLWNTHVDSEYIIPSSGLCRNALLAAARGGSSELARKAGQILEQRDFEEGTGVGLELEELEMLLKAHVNETGEKKNEKNPAAVERIKERIINLKKGEREK